MSALKIKNLSIDSIIYSFHENELKVLLVKHAEGISSGMWGLPGGWVNEEEDIDTAAYRILKTHTGLDDVYLEQLKAFGNVNRYPYERVITISYFALVKESDVEIQPGCTVFEAKWFNITDLPNLIFDHQDIVDFSIKRLQHIVRHEPIGFILLPEKFTLLQLQSLYETILQTTFDKPNFRRKLLNMKFLINLKEKQTNVSHRAANLYKFDIEVYNKLKDRGFNFDL